MSAFRLCAAVMHPDLRPGYIASFAVPSPTPSTPRDAPMPPLSFLPDSFAEYEDLKAILDQGSASFAIRTLCETTVRGRRFGVHTASIGSTDPRAPTIGFFGGMHGLERIGSQLV